MPCDSVINQLKVAVKEKTQIKNKKKGKLGLKSLLKSKSSSIFEFNKS